jgi:hypothetical protein
VALLLICSIINGATINGATVRKAGHAAQPRMVTIAEGGY